MMNTAEEQRLRNALKKWQEYAKKLESERAELLAACEGLVEEYSSGAGESCDSAAVRYGRIAIANARNTEEKK